MLENAGNSLAPITIRGAGGVAVLDGQETMSIGFWCENCSNFTFENLEIHGYTDVGIGVYPSSNIVMRNLKVYRVSGSLQSGHIGLPNLFGFFALYPQQVGESNTLTLRNPKEPDLWEYRARYLDRPLELPPA